MNFELATLQYLINPPLAQKEQKERQNQYCLDSLIALDKDNNRSKKQWPHNQILGEPHDELFHAREIEPKQVQTNEPKAF